MTVIPRQLYLKGVSKIGKFPAGGGGFADVWMGKHDGGTVALKVPRSFGSDSIKAVSKYVFSWTWWSAERHFISSCTKKSLSGTGYIIEIFFHYWE